MKINFLSLAALTAFSMNPALAHQLSLTAPGAVHSGTSGEFTSFEVDGGVSYKNEFYFTLGKSFNLKTSATINTEDGSSLDIYYVTLFKYNPFAAPGAQTPSNLGTYSFGTTSTPHVFANVVRGNYFYAVWGTNPSTTTDQIAFQSHLAVVQITPNVEQVPEPETYALLLAGLGVVGFVAYRRQIL